MTFYAPASQGSSQSTTRGILDSPSIISPVLAWVFSPKKCANISKMSPNQSLPRYPHPGMMRPARKVSAPTRAIPATVTADRLVELVAPISERHTEAVPEQCQDPHHDRLQLVEIEGARKAGVTPHRHHVRNHDQGRTRNLDRQPILIRPVQNLAALPALVVAHVRVPGHTATQACLALGLAPYHHDVIPPLAKGRRLLCLGPQHHLHAEQLRPNVEEATRRHGHVHLHVSTRQLGERARETVPIATAHHQPRDPDRLQRAKTEAAAQVEIVLHATPAAIAHHRDATKQERHQHQFLHAVAAIHPVQAQRAVGDHAALPGHVVADVISETATEIETGTGTREEMTMLMDLEHRLEGLVGRALLISHNFQPCIICPPILQFV